MEFMETFAPIIELSVVYALLSTTGRLPARAERTTRERGKRRRVGDPTPRVHLAFLSPFWLLSLTDVKRSVGASPDEALDVRATRMKERL